MSLIQGGGMGFHDPFHSVVRQLTGLGWTHDLSRGMWLKRDQDGRVIGEYLTLKDAWQWEVWNAAAKAAARHAARPRYHWGLETALSMGESA